MNEPRWIKDDLVVLIHNRQLAEHGGMEGIRDEGLLSSALARPRHLFAYESYKADMAALAAAYAYGIARNHPFIDGNKRTAAVVCETFIELNGYSLSATDEEMFLAFLRLAEGAISEEDLASWIRERLQAN